MRHPRDAKIAEYYALKPSRFPVAKTITFTQGTDPMLASKEARHHLTLKFFGDGSFTGDSLQLELFSVWDFTFEQPPLSQFCLELNIERIRDGGDDDRNFAVFNAEQDVEFACSCRDFIAAIVRQP